MVSEAEELQAKEFLKRAEIRTMKKDLQALREFDALKERDKIIKIKNLEEQREERAKQLQAEEKARAVSEKSEREEILQKNQNQERLAAEDLKKYALEQELQQIFLLESERLELEKQIDAIDKEKDPSLKLEKNSLLIKKRDEEKKLEAILSQEKKLEDEQKFIIEKEQTTAIASQKKSLEQTRWDLDKKIQDVEKERWAEEKSIKDIDEKISQTDKSSEQLVIEKNSLRDKILGIDKSLREIYSVIMKREEEKRQNISQQQIEKREALAKLKAAENEKIQRQQWSRTPAKEPSSEEEYLSKIPEPIRERLMSSAKTEEEQRKKFIENVKNRAGEQNEKPKTETPSSAEALPIPPVPRKKIKN